MDARLVRSLVVAFSLALLLALARAPEGHTQTDPNVAAFDDGKTQADNSAIHAIPNPPVNTNTQSKGSCSG